MEHIVALIVLPLDTFSYCFERLYQWPLALPLSLVLAGLPPQWVIHALSLVRLYPSFSALASVVTLAVSTLCWFLFGQLFVALASTLCWFTWYSPLLYCVGRLVWVLCRRYVLGRLGWRQRIDETTGAMHQSIQVKMQGVIQSLVSMVFRFTTQTQTA